MTATPERTHVIVATVDADETETGIRLALTVKARAIPAAYPTVADLEAEVRAHLDTVRRTAQAGEYVNIDAEARRIVAVVLGFGVPYPYVNGPTREDA